MWRVGLGVLPGGDKCRKIVKACGVSMYRIHSKRVVGALFKLLTSAPIIMPSLLIQALFGALFGARVVGGAEFTLTSTSGLADAAVAATAVGCSSILFFGGEAGRAQLSWWF